MDSTRETRRICSKDTKKDIYDAMQALEYERLIPFYSSQGQTPFTTTLTFGLARDRQVLDCPGDPKSHFEDPIKGLG